MSRIFIVVSLCPLIYAEMMNEDLMVKRNSRNRRRTVWLLDSWLQSLGLQLINQPIVLNYSRLNVYTLK